MKKSFKLLLFACLLAVAGISASMAGNEVEEMNTENATVEATLVAQPEERAPEGIGCKVFDEHGNKIASCWVCNCAELAENAKR